MPAPAITLVYLAFVGSAAILAVVLLGLRRTVDRSGWRTTDRAWAWKRTSRILIAWYLVALALSGTEFFRDAPHSIPTIELGIVLPVIVGAIALRQSDSIDRLVYATPQSWLVGVQVYRLLGIVFLVLLSLGQLPAAFALPAGIGDLLIGVSAPVLALASASGTEGRDRLLRLWNWLGLIGLAVVAATTILTTPSPFQQLSLGAPNQLISAFPLVMIPVFTLPLAALLHLMSLGKLRQSRRRKGRGRGAHRTQAL